MYIFRSDIGHFKTFDSFYFLRKKRNIYHEIIVALSIVAEKKSHKISELLQGGHA